MLSDPEGYIRSVNTVYILSIPSFHWHAVQGDVADIYQNARATQTCNLAGQRQVVVVGGDLSYINAGRTTDAWTNGIAVYDMAALQWSDRYDANAEPYQRSPDLQKAQEGRVYPNTWDSPELEAIFRLPSQDEDKGLSTGAIAGIAVGAVVVIIAITGGFCLCLWRRRRRHRYESAKTGPHTPPDGRINDREGKAELPESRHYTTELDGRARHELE